jgi:hypothetical protein
MKIRIDALAITREKHINNTSQNLKFCFSEFYIHLIKLVIIC